MINIFNILKTAKSYNILILKVYNIQIERLKGIHNL